MPPEQLSALLFAGLVQAAGQVLDLQLEAVRGVRGEHVGDDVAVVVSLTEPNDSVSLLRDRVTVRSDRVARHQVGGVDSEAANAGGGVHHDLAGADGLAGGGGRGERAVGAEGGDGGGATDEDERRRRS